MSHLLLRIVYETKLGSSFKTRLHPGVLYTTSETRTTTTTITTTTTTTTSTATTTTVVSRCPVWVSTRRQTVQRWYHTRRSCPFSVRTASPSVRIPTQLPSSSLSINQSTNQSISQSLNQPVIQSLNPNIRRSIKFCKAPHARLAWRHRFLTNYYTFTP